MRQGGLTLFYARPEMGASAGGRAIGGPHDQPACRATCLGVGPRLDVYAGGVVCVLLPAPKGVPSLLLLGRQRQRAHCGLCAARQPALRPGNG